MEMKELKRETGLVAPEWREGERCEPFRNVGATSPEASALRSGAPVLDPELGSKTLRRQFSAAYKRRRGWGPAAMGIFSWLVAVSAMSRLLFSAATRLTIPVLRRKIPAQRRRFHLPGAILLPALACGGQTT